MKKSYRAGAIVLNKKGEIALANEHLWGFPRGGVDNGEEYILTAKREVLEEVGLNDFYSIEELDMYERYPHGITKDTPGAYPMQIYMFLFKTDFDGQLQPKDDNVKEAKWFRYDEALEKLTNIEDRDFLEGVKSKIF